MADTHTEGPGPDRPFSLPPGWRPRAIAFDAFGTLVEITDRRRPYHRFTPLARARGVATDPLVTDVSMAAWARSFDVPEDEIASAEADLAAEAGSVRLREWVPEAWAAIREAGIPIAVCSNLATPYGAPLLAVLSDDPDAVILSYEAGLKKPNPAIYALVARELGRDPSGILFVGDTRSADYDGPRAAGMQAMPVQRFELFWQDVVC